MGMIILYLKNNNKTSDIIINMKFPKAQFTINDSYICYNCMLRKDSLSLKQVCIVYMILIVGNA